MVWTNNLRLDYMKEDLNEVGNLNSKYLSGKYPNSFIWSLLCSLRILRRICCCGTKPELTLLERLDAWDLKVEWEHLFQTIPLSDLDEKITFAGYERHPKGNSETSYLARKYIYFMAFHTKTENTA